MCIRDRPGGQPVGPQVLELLRQVPDIHRGQQRGVRVLPRSAAQRAVPQLDPEGALGDICDELRRE
eukprot:6029443-Pyramimonas_sp.AAC.1